MKLLHIDSSILDEGSVSRALSSETVAALKQQDPSMEVIRRDLAEAPLGHLTGAHLAAFQGQRPDVPALRPDIAAGETALEEFLAADILVIGAPMYNFAVPTQLKAWIDRLCVAGRTFHYTKNGPEGLAGGKKVIVAVSRGGFYGADTPMAAFEHQESYLRVLFGFLGITDITFIHAEGIALGPDQREAAMSGARKAIRELLAVA